MWARSRSTCDFGRRLHGQDAHATWDAPWLLGVSPLSSRPCFFPPLRVWLRAFAPSRLFLLRLPALCALATSLIHHHLRPPSRLFAQTSAACGTSRIWFGESSAPTPTRQGMLYRPSSALPREIARLCTGRTYRGYHRQIDFPSPAFYTVKDDKITREQFFYDGAH